MTKQDNPYNQNILISILKKIYKNILISTNAHPTAQSQKKASPSTLRRYKNMMTNVSGQQYAQDDQKGINKFRWTKKAPLYHY